MKSVKRNIVILSSDVLCATLFFLASALLLSTTAYAQGARYDGTTQARSGFPAPAVSIAVCSQPATTTTAPCSPLAVLYTDATLATPCSGVNLPPNVPGSACSNPMIADGLGNFHFYAAASVVTLQFYGSGITTYSQPDLRLVNGSNAAAPAGVNGNLQCNVGTGVFAVCPDITDLASVTTITSDAAMYGPNPSFDLRAYGAYASAAVPASTTGSITTGTTSLVVAGGSTFSNGNGIVVYKAGAATALTTPAQPAVTPIFVANGTTTYNYKVIAEDRNGALTASSTAGTTTTGAATLGSNFITLTNCTRVSGVATYTSSGNHNLVVGAQVNINGFTFPDICSGVKTVATTPSGTTFTTNDGNTGDINTNGSSPTAQVFACNKLDFASSSYSGDNTIHYWIYRSTGAGAYALIGVAQGIDPFYVDCGLAAPIPPAYIPALPPGSTQPGYLATTVVAGGGTTSLTLALAASTTATTQTVLHDNSLALRSCAAAAIAALGGTCYVPNVSSNMFVFNATTDLSTLSALNAFKIHLADTVVFNQPFIPRSNMELEGEAKDQTAFGYVPMVQVLGTGYPLILGAFSTTAFHMKQLMIVALNSQQVGFLADAAPNNGGPVGIISDDVFYIGDSSRNWPIILKAGFDYRISGGGVANGSGGTTFSPTAGLLLTGASPAVVSNAGTSQLPGIVKLTDVFFNGKGIVFDCTPKDQNFFTFTYEITGSLYESQVAPFVRASCRGVGGAGGGFIAGLYFNKIILADQAVGPGTPVIDSQGSALGSVMWLNGQGISGPLVIGSNSSLTVINVNSATTGNGSVLAIAGANLATTGVLSASGSGYLGQVMLQAAAPGVVVSAGGAVPAATVGYAVHYKDANGVWSPFSKTTIVTPTIGNQTVTITPPAAPIGAVALQVGRTGGGGPNSQDFSFIANAASSCGNFDHLVNEVVVDNTSFACGTVNNIGVATLASVGPSGLSGGNVNFIERAAPSGTVGLAVTHANATDHTLHQNSNNNGDLAFTGAWSCTNVTPVTVNTNTTADQNVMACTIPAGALNRVNRTLRVAASGIYSTPAASTAQMTVKLKLCTVSGCGSGTVITPISIQSTALGTVQITNDNWSFSALSTTQTAGASSAYETHGDFLIDLSTLTTAADSAFGDTNTATVGTIDSTAQLFLQCTFAFSAASASNSATQRQLVVETVN